MATVVIPTLNEEKNIENVLKDLQNQTERCEVIVVDSCSKDATVEIAKSYNARVFVTKCSIGRARHLGTIKASSPYVLQTDADARLPSDWVEGHLKHLQDYYIATGSVEQPYESPLAHFNPFFIVLLYYGSNSGIAAMAANLSYRRSAYVGFPDRNLGEDIVFLRKMIKMHGLDKHIHDSTLKIWMRCDIFEWFKKGIKRNELFDLFQP